MVPMGLAGSGVGSGVGGGSEVKSPAREACVSGLAAQVAAIQPNPRKRTTAPIQPIDLTNLLLLMRP